MNEQINVIEEKNQACDHCYVPEVSYYFNCAGMQGIQNYYLPGFLNFPMSGVNSYYYF
jgi:hypothetical protein